MRKRLIALLEDREVRHLAADVLLRVAATDPDRGTRDWALVALGQTRDQAVLPYLRDQLHAIAVERRRVAAFAPGELGDPATLPALEAARRREPLHRRFDFIRASWKIRRREMAK